MSVIIRPIDYCEKSVAISIISDYQVTRPVISVNNFLFRICGLCKTCLFPQLYPELDLCSCKGCSKRNFWWNFGIWSNFKAVLLQNSSQHQLHFHLRKPHSNAVMGTMSKRHVGIRITQLFCFRAKPFWVKPFRVRPEIGVHMNAVRWNHDRDPLGHKQTFQLAVFNTFANGEWSCK